MEDIRTLVPEVVDNHLRAGMVPGEGHNHLAQVTGSYQVGQVDTQVLRLVGALAGSLVEVDTTYLRSILLDSIDSHVSYSIATQ